MAKIITTVDELKAIASGMAGEYELGADIDLSGVNWIPLGASADHSSFTKFTGKLDGKGYTISNLNIDLNVRSTAIYAGLFAKVGSCTISNLVIKNAVITVEGYNPHVGILTGYGDNPKYTTISNVSVDGEFWVTHLTSTVTGTPSVAGLIGYINGGTTVNITDCISTVRMHVYGCENTLEVAGFIGYGNTLKLTRCFAFGGIMVETTQDSGINVAGMMSSCNYTEHVDCATAVNVHGALNYTVNTCGKYLTSSKGTAVTRHVWNGSTVSYESVADSEVILLSQDEFVALTAGNASAYNTENVDFANRNYFKLAIDESESSGGNDSTAYNITFMGETYNGVKEIVYNGTKLKKLTLNGTDYIF